MKKQGWGTAVLAMLASFCTLNAHATKILDADEQTLLVTFYSQNQCAEVRKLSRGVDFNQLRPNVIAIVAYCEPEGVDSESLFTKAEKMNSTGDLILILHATYRWKRDHASARPLWEKVLMVARNVYFRDLAKAYLADLISEEDANKPLDLSPTTGLAQFFIGAIHHTNPELPDFVYSPYVASWGVEEKARLSLRHWYPFGSLAGNFVATNDQYFSDSRFNLWTTSLELPLAIHVVPEKDIVVRPFAEYDHISSRPYKVDAGIGVMGIVYHSDYVQSVQGSVYNERIFIPNQSSGSGAHYRFEYEWDLYPELWMIALNFAIEHVAADPVMYQFGSVGNFEMSHNDVVISGKLHRDFGSFTIGFEPTAKIRGDTQESIYTLKTTGQVHSEERLDFEVDGQVNVSVPISPSLRLYGWYQYQQIFSNFGPDDYIDRNFKDQVVGLGVRTSISTY